MNKKKDKEWPLKINTMLVSILALVLFIIDAVFILMTEYHSQFMTIFLCVTFFVFACTLILQIYAAIKSSVKTDTALFGLFAVGSFIAIFLLNLYSIPQLVYYAVQCGQAPIAINYYFGSRDITYAKLGDSGAKPGVFDTFVCTEQEAINLGAKYKPDL